jgi:hypothetical protein
MTEGFWIPPGITIQRSVWEGGYDIATANILMRNDEQYLRRCLNSWSSDRFFKHWPHCCEKMYSRDFPNTWLARLFDE